MSKIPFIILNNQEYKLKVTLGFYKRISFPREELQSIYTNGSRMIEVLKLAIFFGNKADRNWQSFADMEKEITDDLLEDIDDNNISEKIGTAIFDNLPDTVQNAINNTVKDDDDTKKK